MLYMQENKCLMSVFKKICAFFSVLALFCCSNPKPNNHENELKSKNNKKADFTRQDVDITGEWYLFGMATNTIFEISTNHYRSSRTHNFTFSNQDSCILSFTKNNELVYENHVIGYWETVKNPLGSLSLSDVLSDTLISPIPMNMSYSVLKMNNIYLHLIKLYCVPDNEPKIRVSYIFRRTPGFKGPVINIP